MDTSFNQWIDYSKNLTLLYVEDNDAARMGSMIIFEELFGKVIEAVDGEDGLEKFKSHTIDIVITDINMPKQTGLEMTGRIHEISPQTPILVLSAYNESHYFIESIRQGVEGYLLKPIEMKQLFEALGKVVEKIHLKIEHDKLQALLVQYLEITDKSAIVSKTNTQGIVTYVNDAFCKISGYTRDEIIGRKHNLVRHEETTDDLFKELWGTIIQGKVWQGLLKNRSKNGKSYYVKTAVKPITNLQGDIVEYIALCNDITEVMNPKKQLLDYMSTLKEAIVVLICVEDFAMLEEFYSNYLVELFEETLGKKLLSSAPKECAFAKIYLLGSGEYAFVVDKYKTHLSLVEFTQKVHEFLEEMDECIIHLEEIEYSASLIGSIAYGGNEPFASAQFGLKKAKKSKVDFFASTNLVSEMHAQAQSNIAIIKAVKQSLMTSRIISYFQPIVDNTTKHIVKFESLVRLIDDDGNAWPPSKFLEVAKKGRYYTQITQRVLENSFQALYETDVTIAINLSVLDIEEDVTRQKILTLLETHKDEAHRITFELLEDENVKEFDILKQFIKNVKSRGVSIAIDDFGSGYSNFERLLDYEPDVIKIDGSLIKNIATDDYSISIVRAIVGFASGHGIKTVAEYVENETIFNILHSLGVDYSQGYYFGKPEPLAYYIGLVR